MAMNNPSPNTEFHLFSCLPFELRQEIWRHSLQPRVVEVEAVDDPETEEIRYLASPDRPPTVIQVCHEARSHCDLYSRKFTGGTEPRYIWVVYNFDTIRIHDACQEDEVEEERASIRFLQLIVQDFEYFQDVVVGGFGPNSFASLSTLLLLADSDVTPSELTDLVQMIWVPQYNITHVTSEDMMRAADMEGLICAVSDTDSVQA